MASGTHWRAALTGAVLLVAACGGGGGDSGTSPPPPPSPPVSPPPPPPPPPPVQAALSGVVRATQNLFADGDVNDPDAALISNNDVDRAQSLTAIGPDAPRVVTGWVSASPTGAPGDRFETAADPADYYRISARRNDVILLDFRDDEKASGDYDALTGLDIDLRVYDSTGQQLLLGSSSCCSPYELALVPEDGDYVIEVSAFHGGASYVLSVSPELTVPAVMPESAHELSLIAGDISVEREPRTDVGRAFAQRQIESPLPGGGLAGARLVGIDARARAADVERATGLRSELRARARLTSQAAGAAAGAAPVDARALLDLVKVLNAYEQDDVFKLIHRPRTMLTPTSDPADVRGQQWNLGVILWSRPEVRDAIDLRLPPLIAVLDGGFYTSHSEIASAIVDQRDFVPEIDLDGDGTPDDDGYDADAEDVVDPAQPGSLGECHVFHGTHVASVAAAREGNGGIVGVHPRADLMLVRLGRNIPPTCGQIFSFADALRYAAGLDNASGVLPARKADVVNMSFGGPYATRWEREAIEAALAEGLILVAAAGNEGDQGARAQFPSYPAAYDGVIAVGAMTNHNGLAFYSSYYPELDLVAPGGGPDGSAYPDPETILGGIASASEGSFAPDYGAYFGTSMAAAHVSGGFALMKSIAPSLTAWDVEAILRNGDLTGIAVGTYPPGGDTTLPVAGFGMVELDEMVSAASGFAAGAPLPAPGAYAVTSPARFELGMGDNAITFELRKICDGPLAVTGSFGDGRFMIRADDAGADGFGRYTIYADRFGTGSNFSGSAYFTLSNGKTMRLNLFAEGWLTTLTHVGVAPVHVQLQRQDGEDFTVLEDHVPTGSLASGVDFGFDNLALGAEYRLVAGTDIDNDGQLCDAGELCSLYPSPFTGQETFTWTGQPPPNVTLRLVHHPPPPDAEPL